MQAIKSDILQYAQAGGGYRGKGTYNSPAMGSRRIRRALSEPACILPWVELHACVITARAKNRTSITQGPRSTVFKIFLHDIVLYMVLA